MANVRSAEAIRNLRLRLGWSTSEFSRRFGCLTEVIVQWEAGTAAPTQDDSMQMDRLEFHLHSYNEIVTCDPIAGLLMKDQNLEQVHHDQVKRQIDN